MDRTHNGEGYCKRCGMYTFYGRHVASVKDRRKWEFVCELCLQKDGENDAWTDEDEEDLQADRKFHMLRDEGKI